MSARKIDSGLVQPLTVQTQATQLNLPVHAVRLRRNGIEFASFSPVATWTEMVITLQLPLTGKRLHCSGVVVACEGNRHRGFQISMLFTSVSSHMQAELDTLARSEVA
jgi:hypothetical protein